MTDPDAAKLEPAEEVPPPQPPRPQGRRELSQLEADELYARQLAEQYDNVGAYERRTSNNQTGGQRSAQNVREEDRDYNFMEDELPVIRENLRKGFLETQTKVNGWITGFRKKLEESFDESNDGPEGPAQPLRRQGEPGRRSGDYDRYDADPQVLGDDFANIRLNADGCKYFEGHMWNLSRLTMHQLLRDILVPTLGCTDHLPRLRQDRATDVMLGSRKKRKKSTCTTLHREFLPRTLHQGQAARRASGSHFPRSTQAQSQTTIRLALVIARMRKISRTSPRMPSWRRTSG